MLNNETKEQMQELLTGEVLFAEPLSGHSTIKVGGEAETFASPANIDELVSLLKFSKENKIPTFILGVGSNVLFRDGGFNGLVISTTKLTNFSLVEKNEDSVKINAESGVTIRDLVNFSLEEGVLGLDVLAGIPGTIGGAIAMNAGTKNGVVSDALVEVEAVDKGGRFYTWPKDKIEFKYRSTKFPRSCALTLAQFSLKKTAKEEVEGKVRGLRDARLETQPLKWPTLGSIFKNPDKGPAAGVLIDEAGLKGVRVGGARISNEHANWIINENNASSKDIEVLIHLVREKVKEKSDVTLETEIVVVGEK